MNVTPVSAEDGQVKTSTTIAKIGETYEQPFKPGSFTPALYQGLQAAFSFFNERFFEAALPDVVITLQRRAHSKGHFGANAYAGRHGRDVPQCEINLNPDHFAGATDADAASTLLHEQCHLWRLLNGPPQKRPYHDKLWAARMKSVGLVPSSTGTVGGREVGARMSHYILPDGPFGQAFAELQATGWTLDLESAPRRGSTKGPSSKTKFTCLRCGLNAWAKPDAELWCKSCSLASGQPVNMPAEGAAYDRARAAE
jgi:hypothetical protein